MKKSIFTLLFLIVSNVLFAMNSDGNLTAYDKYNIFIHLVLVLLVYGSITYLLVDNDASFGISIPVLLLVSFITSVVEMSGAGIQPFLISILCFFFSQLLFLILFKRIKQKIIRK